MHPCSYLPVRACLFDMDGLLLNTEDIYTDVVNIILKENNRPLMPWSIKAQLQGRPYAAVSLLIPLFPPRFSPRHSVNQTVHGLGTTPHLTIPIPEPVI